MRAFAAAALLAKVPFAPVGTTAPQMPATHWAFQPVRRPEIPVIDSPAVVPEDGRAGRRPLVSSNTVPPIASSPVDAFILRRVGKAQLAPRADKRTLLRRATFDITGLPPTPEELDSFLGDNSPGAFAKVVERLLASPHYGEHWGRKWLDVVRYADTAGENSDHPLPHAWRYRNWVIKTFNDDKPYDEFLREQIAGDLLAGSGPHDQFADRVIATGYLAIARRFGHDIDKDMHLTLEDTIDTLGKSVLGLTLGCARCHDHKNDPVTARDYYGLYGIFESTRFAFPGCEPKQQPRDLVPLWSAEEIAAKRKPFENQLAALDAAIKTLNDQQDGFAMQLRQLATNATALLAKGEFKDGGAQTFATNSEPLSLNVKTGEMVQLTVLPRANYGVDTTVIEFNVEEADGQRRWNLTTDVVDDFLAGNPHADQLGNAATWCFLDPRKGLQLLPDAVRDHEGKKGLHIWRNGDNPAAFVNSTDQPIKAWTTLPARTFFVHPAPDGPVAVAWLSPVTGAVRLTGRVADGHPGGGDGVAWTLEHSAADFGPGLNQLATQARDLREPLRQRAELKAREPKVPVAYAVVDGKAKNTKLQKRGDPEQLGSEVPRKFLDILGGQTVSTTNQSGRLELAQWLTNPTNPLTARVMVNRIWQGHFGTGLVETPNDFGRQGRPPTHPELLDWLASEFIACGWSVKGMHRLVMATAAYQQSSAGADVRRLTSAGPDQRLLTSPSANRMDITLFPRRRLTAEELRDTLLAVTGELDRTPGEAHPFPPEDKWSYTQHGPFAESYDTLKRSVYVMQKRNRRIPFFALFDGPDPNASTAKRDITTVPTQALYFMNDPFVHARAEKFASRLLKSAPDDRARIDFAYRQLFGRIASNEEQADVAEFLRDHASACADKPADQQSALGWAAYARVLFGSNELLYLD